MILRHSTRKEEMVYILEWMNFCLSIEREVFLLRGKMRLKSYMTFRQDGGVGYNGHVRWLVLIFFREKYCWLASFGLLKPTSEQAEHKIIASFSISTIFICTRLFREQERGEFFAFVLTFGLSFVACYLTPCSCSISYTVFLRC